MDEQISKSIDELQDELLEERAAWQRAIEGRDELANQVMALEQRLVDANTSCHREYYRGQREVQIALYDQIADITLERDIAKAEVKMLRLRLRHKASKP